MNVQFKYFMTASSSPSQFNNASLFARVAMVLGITAVLVALIVFFFPWDVLRGPLNRFVSDKTGRHFEITRRLDVRLGSTTTVIADGIEFANPSWAREQHLVKADLAEIQIRLWPLLRGRIEFPSIKLEKPQLGLQIEADGKRTWAFGKDTSDETNVPRLGTLVVDQGVLNYLAVAQGTDIAVDFQLASEASSVLPLSFDARGKWKGESFAAKGRAGGVLQLNADKAGTFPIEVAASAGATRLKAEGTVTNLAELGQIDVNFELQGRSLEDLYKLVGVVLPGTPAYKLAGQLKKHGRVWAVADIKGVLGKSDLSGALTFDSSKAVPLLTGKVQSRRLDFNDLGPIVGVPAGASKSVADRAVPSKSAKPERTSQRRAGKVLPVARLEFARLKSMNADVWFSSADIQHVEALPLNSISVHIKLEQGVLQLDPLKLGVAGGTLSGRLGIDSHASPSAIDVRLNAQAIRLDQLFPTVEKTKSALGKITGQIDLKGKGASTAEVLASASGNVAFLMGQGEISNILMEFMGLDGGEVIKFLVRGDQNVVLRCAAAAFEVQRGLMTTRTIVLDTSDTVINGSGQISLANETLDLLLLPAPKDSSILSLRSPLRIGGTFSAPTAGPDKGALAGRVGLAAALAAINPLLALAATVETGPGKDADCSQVLKQAAATNRRPVAPAAK